MKKRFRGLTKERALTVVVLIAFLGASGYFGYKAFQLPTSAEEQVTLCSYEHSGVFNYTVHLKPNTLTDASVLGPGYVYFTRITDVFDVTFSYDFSCDSAVCDAAEEYNVIVRVEAPDLWNKTILTRSGASTGAFSIDIPLNITRIDALIKAIEEELWGWRSYSANYRLIVEVEVHTMAETEFRDIDEIFDPTLVIKLEENVIRVEGDINHNSSGSITETRTVSLQGVVFQRIFSIVAVVGTGSTLWYMLTRGARKGGELSGIDEEAEKVKKKHGDLIVEAEAPPEYGEGRTIISVKSLEELIKVAEELYKPVIHQKTTVDGETRHVYQVLDGLVRYEYALTD